MKLLIASDIHGAAPACRALLDAFGREGADRLLLLGDILYHGPRNGIPEGYDPKAAAALLNECRDRILCIRGNCDADVDQMMLSFPILAEFALIETQGYVLYATHGHIWNAGHLPPLASGDILLYGHTHVPAWEISGETPCFNPGSVSLPKQQTPRSYMTLTDGVFSWKTLDGAAYHRWPD